MARVVECENLIKIHKQGALEVVALQGLDFPMDEGEFVAVVGRSGAGKSSLLQILAGMDQPSAGRVTVAGVDLADAGPDVLRRHYRRNVGFLWQDYTRNLLPYLPAVRNVELPMLFAGVRRSRRRRRAEALLEATGIANRAYARVHQMSGGEQQRLGLCVALSLGPRLLLADEPTGELDTERSLAVYELLRMLSHEGGLSVMVVTHDVLLAERADRTVRLEDGRMATERTLAAGLDLLAIDQRGRVQLPAELITEAGLTDRVRAEVTDDGLLLRRYRPYVD